MGSLVVVRIFSCVEEGVYFGVWVGDWRREE